MVSQSLTGGVLALPSRIMENGWYKAVVSQRHKLHELQKQVALGIVFIAMPLLVVTTGTIGRNDPRGEVLSADSKTSFTKLFAADTFLANLKSDKPAAHAVVAPSCIEETPSANPTPFANCPSIALNFADFPDGPLNNPAFNTYIGKPEANEEAQLYTANKDNLAIENGNLVLRAVNRQQGDYKYTSARINTLGKEDFQYGKLVVRATLPNQIGTWPAIWMLPSDDKYKQYSSDDSNRDLSDGEIDIAESVGAEPNVVYGIAHSLAYPADGREGYFGTLPVPGNETAFHDYGLEWTPTNLTFTVDGQPYFSISKQPDADYRSWPYDQHYYLILNLALGGNWGGIDRADFPLDGVDSAALPATMKIQSINYYPYVN